ncbi:hypothetical protein [Natronococcus jeotgali]|uniref:hypothetical protein n=1 Tax=Natronococcus jeotgali TaxID=413812 RepID=UPI001267D953|nr:hypothetical protein [Natronococcus jeotgali]
MIEPYRRGVIAAGLASIGGVVGAVGPGEGVDADSSGSVADVEGAADGERTDEADDETGGDDTAASALELSVSAPSSVSATDGRVEFLLTVRNYGDGTASAPIVLEIACLVDELEPLELAPGEEVDAYASYASDRFGPGDHGWTVAVGDRRERGTLSVEKGISRR